MTSQTCEAKLPAACRFHGIGKDLPDVVFTRLEAEINQQLDRSATYKRQVAGDDDARFYHLQNGLATSLWTNAVKSYRYASKLAGYRTKTLPGIVEHDDRDVIHNRAVALFNAAHDLDFDSHRSERLPFKAVLNHVKARNNCSRVAQLLVGKYGAADFGFDGEPRTVRVDAPDSTKPGMVWHHAAVTGERNGQTYVVDYTINQFDKTLPVPYVATHGAWLATLHHATGESWSENHLGQWDIRGGETRADMAANADTLALMALGRARRNH